jgi:hypothetical protein
MYTFSIMVYDHYSHPTLIKRKQWWKFWKPKYTIGAVEGMSWQRKYRVLEKDEMEFIKTLMPDIQGSPNNPGYRALLKCMAGHGVDNVKFVQLDTGKPATTYIKTSQTKQGAEHATN